MGFLDRFKINTRRENRSYLVVGLVLAFIFGGISFLYYQRFLNDGEPYRMEYEGIIVGKPVLYRDSEQGAGVQRLLTVEGENGSRFQVIATKDIYDRA
jgi:hypothetical protein